MKMHHTLVEELIKTFTTYSGWKNEDKLRKMLQQMDLTVYEQQSQAGQKVLVLTEALRKAALNTNS